jgi:hypothetical protein
MQQEKEIVEQPLASGQPVFTCNMQHVAKVMGSEEYCLRTLQEFEIF